MQIPDGPKDCVCPLHRKSMAKVCRTCPLWVRVTMQEPQNGEQVDRWDCSLAWLPSLLINLGKESAANVAATHKVRNVVASIMVASMDRQQLEDHGTKPRLIGNGQ